MSISRASKASSRTIEIGRRETVVEAIAAALIRYIASHKLQGGDKLPSERELVEMIGVSRLPLREALCILKGLGIVEARHGKGVFVKRMDLAAIFSMLSPLLRTQAHIKPADMVLARQHLEPSITALAAVRRTEEHLRALENHLAAMRESLADMRAFIVHDMAFHQELARASGNPVFHVFMAALTDLLRHVQFLYPDKLRYREESVGYHERILGAVRAKNPGKAERLMRQHIRTVARRI
jgi:GntR family transcriptional repressor for pyruvate dehydrogenase complex